MADNSDKFALDLRAVIYATDFSLYSQNAGFYASRIAESFRTKLLVAHAFTLSQAAMEVEMDHLLVSQQRRDLSFLLSRKAAQLSSPSVEAIPMLLEGDPKKAIPRLAEQQAPCLIVLGTHGGGWIERELIGSAAEKILRSTCWPSLTVGPQVRAASSTAIPFKRILFATDFTPEATNAGLYAIAFAKMFEAELNVLNVVSEDAFKHPERLSEQRARFYDGLDKRALDQSKEYRDPKTYIEVGKAGDRILEHIRERSIDLLVLGMRLTSHLGLEMRTSGAFQLILGAECPVLTVSV